MLFKHESTPIGSIRKYRITAFFLQLHFLLCTIAAEAKLKNGVKGKSMMHIKFRPSEIDDMPLLTKLSKDWEEENSCYGYQRNKAAHFDRYRVFVAEFEGEVIGYLFGAVEHSKSMTAIMPAGSTYFEIEELYIDSRFRSQGIGRAFMQYLETLLLSEGIDKMVLSTATKDYKRILHFYIDELGMNFWHAKLFKALKHANMSFEENP